MSELTQSEQWVKEQLEERGWRVLRNGWPDFFCVRERYYHVLDTKEVKYAAVEVKAGNDKVSPAQDSMHWALQKAGLSVVVINPDHLRQDFKFMHGRTGNGVAPSISQEVLLGHVNGLKNRLDKARKDVESLEAEIKTLGVIS